MSFEKRLFALRPSSKPICFIRCVNPAGMSWSADFQKGVATHKKGDYSTALHEFKPLAEQGNVDAQYALGSMHETGEGVVQDNVYAYMWFSIAASSGDEYEPKNRDLIAKEMTPSQIEQAQGLVREYYRKKYKGC